MANSPSFRQPLSQATADFDHLSFPRFFTRIHGGYCLVSLQCLIRMQWSWHFYVADRLGVSEWLHPTIIIPRRIKLHPDHLHMAVSHHQVFTQGKVTINYFHARFHLNVGSQSVLKGMQEEEYQQQGSLAQFPLTYA